MPFPFNQQISIACITVTQVVHSKTASKLAAPIKIIIIIDQMNDLPSKTV